MMYKVFFIFILFFPAMVFAQNSRDSWTFCTLFLTKENLPPNMQRLAQESWTFREFPSIKITMFQDLGAQIEKNIQMGQIVKSTVQGRFLLANVKSNDYFYTIGFDLIENKLGVILYGDTARARWIGKRPPFGSSLEGAILSVLAADKIEAPSRPSDERPIRFIDAINTRLGLLRNHNNNCPNGDAVISIDMKAVSSITTPANFLEAYPYTGLSRFIALDIGGNVGILDLNGNNPVWIPNIASVERVSFEALPFDKIRLRIGNQFWDYVESIRRFIPVSPNNIDYALRFNEGTGREIIDIPIFRRELEASYGDNFRRFRENFRTIRPSLQQNRFIYMDDSINNGGKVVSAILVDMRTDKIWAVWRDGTEIRRSGALPSVGHPARTLLETIIDSVRK